MVSLKSIELNRFGRAIAFMCIDQNHVLLFRLQVVSAIALPNLAQLLEATAQRFSSMRLIEPSEQ